jgi:hypothetical protein
LEKLNERLSQYVPVILAAEWGHADRLLKLLDAADTTNARKWKIISLLGDMMNDEALPKLKEALQDKNLAQQAAVALGNIGKESIPMLIDMLNLQGSGASNCRRQRIGSSRGAAWGRNDLPCLACRLPRTSIWVFALKWCGPHRENAR